MLLLSYETQNQTWSINISTEDKVVTFRTFTPSTAINLGYYENVSTTELQNIVNYLRTKSALLIPQIVNSLLKSYDNEDDFFMAVQTLRLEI